VNYPTRRGFALEQKTTASRPGISRPRIESLSDVIFGLALAISTIPLISRLPQKPFGMLVDISEFGFGFLILMSVWIGYTNIMSVLPVEDSTVVALNLVFLSCLNRTVSLLPEHNLRPRIPRDFSQL